MCSRILLKRVVTVVVLAFGSTSALAIERDADGFWAKPSCNRERIIMMSIDTQKSTGMKSSNSIWDMEIYADEATGDWALLGVKRSDKSKNAEVCILSNGIKNSYKEKRWYDAYFVRPASSPRP